MDIQTIHARFPSQEQAESAVRKLAALRGDRFRLERAGGLPQAADSMAAVEFAGTLGEATPDHAAAEPSAFTLSAKMPTQAAEQARRVIESAGGSMI